MVVLQAIGLSAVEKLVSVMTHEPGAPPTAIDFGNPKEFATDVLQGAIPIAAKDMFTQQVQAFIIKNSFRKMDFDKAVRFGADPFKTTKALLAAREDFLPLQPTVGEKLKARWDVALFYGTDVGLMPALAYNAGFVLWELGHVLTRQAVLRYRRAAEEEALKKEADPHSKNAIVARTRYLEVDRRILSAVDVALELGRVIVWGGVSVVVQTVAGSVGTFILPGWGTYLAELASPLMVKQVFPLPKHAEDGEKKRFIGF